MQSSFHRRLAWALIWALAAGSVSAIQPSPAPASAAARVLEGPHVLWEGRKAQVLRVLEGGVLSVEERQGPFALDLPGLAAAPLALVPEAPDPAPIELPCPPRILAISDLHGHFDTTLALLQAQGVVDAALRWTFGEGHLVVVGDMVDRGTQVTELLWFLHALEGPARAAGGRVHALLGNHEAMVMAGQYRYTQSKYLNPPAGMPSPKDLLGPATELGRWLHSRACLLKLGSFLFVHGGISPAFLERGGTLAWANGGLRSGLGLRPAECEGDQAFLIGKDGPLWYRGLVNGSLPKDSVPSFLEALRRKLGVDTVVVGHTTLPEVSGLLEGHGFAIDAGLKSGKPGEAWYWDGHRAWRALADGRRVPARIRQEATPGHG